MGLGPRKGATQPASHITANTSAVSQGSSYMRVSELNSSQQDVRQGPAGGGQSQYMNNSR